MEECKQPARPRSTPGSADEISSSAGGEGDDDDGDVVDKILKEWMGVKEGGREGGSRA